MPVSEQIAKTQVARFAQYDQFPENAEGLRDFIRVFMDFCDDPEHALQTGNRLVSTHRRCPKPADVCEAAEAILIEAAQQKADDWQSERQPDDEPFSGISDLLDDRLVEILSRKVETGKTYAEREAARKFLAMRKRATA